MPDVSGVTVVTNSRVFYTTREAAGASNARHSLRPLVSGANDYRKTRAQRAARSQARTPRGAFYLFVNGAGQSDLGADQS